MQRVKHTSNYSSGWHDILVVLVYSKSTAHFSQGFVFCQQSVFPVWDFFYSVFEWYIIIVGVVWLVHFILVVNYAEQFQRISTLSGLNYWTGKVSAGRRWRTGEILHTTLESDLLCSLPSLAGLGNRIFSVIRERERGAGCTAKFSPPPSGFGYGETRTRQEFFFLPQQLWIKGGKPGD